MIRPRTAPAPHADAVPGQADTARWWTTTHGDLYAPLPVVLPPSRRRHTADRRSGAAVAAAAVAVAAIVVGTATFTAVTALTVVLPDGVPAAARSAGLDLVRPPASTVAQCVAPGAPEAAAVAMTVAFAASGYPAQRGSLPATAGVAERTRQLRSAAADPDALCPQLWPTSAAGTFLLAVPRRRGPDAVVALQVTRPHRGPGARRSPPIVTAVTDLPTQPALRGQNK